ncbi:MAG: error-prone DNA polymerase [Deltaproteobacteria bacterium]|nr:error-prone DNA polymerase [Deltaproteobacteria bacterium]
MHSPGPSPQDYVELRCRSAFSFLEGASNPEDLVEQAAAQGHEVLALADRDGLYGAPRFHAAAKRAGLRAIVGAELSQAAGGPLVLLAESRKGYRNLARLLTVAQGHAPKGEAAASWDELEEHAGGLTALVPASGSLDRAHLDRLLGVYGAEHTALGVTRAMDRSLEGGNRFAVALAEAMRLPIAAWGDVRVARPDGRRLLDAFTCLFHKTTLDQAGRLLLPNGERTLRTREELAARFADRPAWLYTTRAIAESCAFTFEDLGYRFPTYPVPVGESQDSWLRKLTFRGAGERYGTPLPPRARAQLEHELTVIGKLELAGYFLIVCDIARYARERGILCQGRGSAANSAVCYALAITAVDPVGMELLFERFLSEERGEWPDIDLDLPSGDQREDAIQYVYEKYGPHGVGMTATVISYRTRSAFREIGKVLGMESDFLDRLSKKLRQFHFREDLDEARDMLREAGVDPRSPRVALLLELAGQMQGLPRHLGQHTGGLVIAQGRLDEVVPIEPAAMPDRKVVQWDKDDCADLGIIKIDLLGLGMLDALEKTLPLIRDFEGVEIDLAHLPPDDPKTYGMIQKADTVGVFQIESRAQMATLPRMKPTCFYDLVVEIAIIRPGPIVGKMVHPYLNRRAGREPVEYPHPSLEPILKRTLGVPIFQEQLLRLAMEASGFTGGEAEELRRAMGFKRSVERMGQIEERLRSGMTERGITGEAQDEIVRGITSFALYGFPESHSASFALIAYASAYLRAHHPAAFLVGLLNAWPMGFYNPATLVKDGQRHGVVMRPIDVAHSTWPCTLEPGEHGPEVRVGLRYVAGLSKDTGEQVASARATGPFASLADFAARVGPKRNEILALAEAGTLASIDPAARTRRSALWQVSAIERDSNSLFAGAPPPGSDVPSPLPELTPAEATLADYRTTGLTTGPHVLQHLRPELTRRGVLPAAALRNQPNGRFVRTAGHVIVRQRPGSAKGFCFLTLEDETGTSNAVLTPDAFARLRVPLHASPLLEIAGTVQNVDGVIHVKVGRIDPLDTKADASSPRGGSRRGRGGYGSHDYH